MLQTAVSCVAYGFAGGKQKFFFFCTNEWAFVNRSVLMLLVFLNKDSAMP